MTDGEKKIKKIRIVEIDQVLGMLEETKLRLAAMTQEIDVEVEDVEQDQADEGSD